MLSKPRIDSNSSSCEHHKDYKASWATEIVAARSPVEPLLVSMELLSVPVSSAQFYVN